MAQSCSSPALPDLSDNAGRQAGLVSSGHMSEPVSGDTHANAPRYVVRSRGSFSTRPRMFRQVHADVAGTGSPQRHHGRGKHMLRHVFRMISVRAVGMRKGEVQAAADLWIGTFSSRAH